MAILDLLFIAILGILIIPGVYSLFTTTPLLTGGV